MGPYGLDLIGMVEGIRYIIFLFAECSGKVLLVRKIHKYAYMYQISLAKAGKGEQDGYGDQLQGRI